MNSPPTQYQCISRASGYLGLSLRGKACPQCVQRLADDRGGTRGQTPAHKVNSGRLAVVCRRVVHGFSQKLEADKLRPKTVSTCLRRDSYLFSMDKTQIALFLDKPGRRRSKWRAAVPGCGPSKKQRHPPLIECSGTPGKVPSTFPLVSLKTQVQSGAVAGMKNAV